MEATADIQMQWREMGVALGISTTVLDEISSLMPFDELRCLYEMLHHWVLDIGATWGGLVGAMRSSNVKQIQMASDLESNHYLGGKLYSIIVFLSLIIMCHVNLSHTVYVEYLTMLLI